MFRTLRVLVQSLCLTCPACQHGRMFRSRFRMNVRCPVCGVIFERDGGEVTGGMAINSLVTSTLVFVGSGLAAIYTELSLLLLFMVLGIFALAFSVWFYRYARGLWVGIIYLTGSMFED